MPPVAHADPRHERLWHLLPVADGSSGVACPVSTTAHEIPCAASHTLATRGCLPLRERRQLYARADAHTGPDGYRLDLMEDPTWISSVVRFDRPPLGDVCGLDGLHIQCHQGTDTLSPLRLGARTTGQDLSSPSLEHARALAEGAGEQVDYVKADAYSAPEALHGCTFDLVYTGIGALCWLPDIGRWAQTVAHLLRPGGRLFVRDAHPVLKLRRGTRRPRLPPRPQPAAVELWAEGRHTRARTAPTGRTRPV